MRILFRCLYSDRSPDIQVSHMLVNKRLTSMLSRRGRGGPLSSGGSKSLKTTGLGYRPTHSRLRLIDCLATNMASHFKMNLLHVLVGYKIPTKKVVGKWHVLSPG